MSFDPASSPQPHARSCGSNNGAPSARSGVFGLGAAPVAPPSYREMDCARMREWVVGAQCNALVAYARGLALSLCCPEPLRIFVMRLHEQGYLTPHLMRDGQGGTLYVVRRSGRPVAPGARL